MASSRKSSRSSRHDLTSRVAAQLENVVKPFDRVAVGLSGGVDSVVLLDCLQRLARKLRIRVSALHVNHQLSPNAGRWAAFCRRVCRARRVPFTSVKVLVARGNSLEAAARAARYAVYRGARADYVALAQHQDDQVETVLLQLLRGAGVRGLAAMPLLRAEGRGSRVEGTSKAHKVADSSSLDTRHSTLDTRHPTPAILRPLLDITRAEIESYAKARGLEWIEDESNADPRIPRNFLRHRVLPVLARRFPAYRITIARAARHLAEASGLLDGVAAGDGAAYLDSGTLSVEGLRRLPSARARNLLRFFLAGQGVSLPGADRLAEALRQALTAKQDARVLIELDGVQLRRYAGRLHVVRTAGSPRRRERRWNGERELALPELGGVLQMTRARGEGVSLARLGPSKVTIGVRKGGERLQPDCRRPRRSLKNLLQEARVPPWERERAPLIFCDGELVWAAGVGVDCAFQAARNEAALRPKWVPRR